MVDLFQQNRFLVEGRRDLFFHPAAFGHLGLQDLIDPLEIHRAFLHAEFQLFMGAAQGVLRVFPFYRILDDPPDGIGRGLSLDEIVLRTFMKRLHPDRFIIERRQNHHGHAVRAIAETQEGGQALAVRQGQVQQNHIEMFVPQTPDRLAHLINMGEIELIGTLLREDILRQLSVNWVVFNQQDLDHNGWSQVSALPVRLSAA